MWRKSWPVALRASAMVENAHAMLPSGPGVVKSRRGGMGLVATRDISPGDRVAFLAKDDIFDAENVYKRSQNPLIAMIKEALEGYAGLKEAQPAAFGELELALLLWAERRSLDPSSGCSNSPWNDWLKDLPDNCATSAAFLTDNLLDQMVCIDKGFSSENMDDLKKEVKVYNHVIDVFTENIGEDLLSAFTIIEGNENLLWGRGDPDKQAWPFNELFREELSLVGSRAYNLSRVRASIGPDRVCLPGVNDVCLFTGIDFFNHSRQPNTDVVITSQPKTEPGQVLTEFNEPAVSVIANTHIAKDEELTICYSRGSGRQMLFRYGFVEPGVPMMPQEEEYPTVLKVKNLDWEKAQ
mmetsp:Transcript_15284/g.24851  ORF Transcript_15284/g.24851 Transcript_15284/m.24851 type:complete len:353 (-) Transcript_15284:356-1414(-)